MSGDKWPPQLCVRLCASAVVSLQLPRRGAAESRRLRACEQLPLRGALWHSGSRAEQLARLDAATTLGLAARRRVAPSARDGLVAVARAPVLRLGMLYPAPF